MKAKDIEIDIHFTSSVLLAASQYVIHNALWSVYTRLLFLCIISIMFYVHIFLAFLIQLIISCFNKAFFFFFTELVPDSVKRELLAEIKKFLAAQTQ